MCQNSGICRALKPEERVLAPRPERILSYTMVTKNRVVDIRRALAVDMDGRGK
jgi:ABC-type hemin transport system substrate-binding protein